MTRHTPGPWRHNAVGRLKACAVWADATVDHALGPESAVFICSTHATQTRFADAPEDEQDANARLIASAPELLAACKAVLDGLNSYEDAGGIVAAHLCRSSVVQSLLRAAISKAEGKE